jgi:hypothetical protein
VVQIDTLKMPADTLLAALKAPIKPQKPVKQSELNTGMEFVAHVRATIDLLKESRPRIILYNLMQTFPHPDHVNDDHRDRTLQIVAGLAGVQGAS